MPLGTGDNQECRIDLVAQAWAVLSDAAPLALQSAAMDAADSHLVDRNAGLVKLLAPPLQVQQPSAGYIQAYPPGVRENGGQYAHAAVWALMAQARLHQAGSTHSATGVSRADLAYAYFTYLSPAHRSTATHTGEAYGLEPYAMAGDVYAAPPYTGQGGWSWYTGAAGLMHRAVVESIFGLQQGASHLCFHPCLPSHWPQAEMTLRRDGKTLHFLLLRMRTEDAIAEAARRGHTLLEVGIHLNWTAAPHGRSFLVPVHSPASVFDAVQNAQGAQ
ncbi:MAG: hypothetical protein CFE44_09915 [Burkholderiales bacterium PBB4]|nr:MAG: hypothetical protein CFE44_09915 [Burkholderiales bacterium PBB4]